MSPLDPTRALRYAVWGLSVLILGGLALRIGFTPRESDPARDILAVDLARRMHADALALDSARVALVRDQAQTVRQLARYSGLRDTLVITDTVAVREFVQRADSVVRSCTELSESCERFRVRADSSLASLTLDRDRWRHVAEDSRPNAMSQFVHRTLPVVAFVGGVWLGSRAVR